MRQSKIKTKCKTNEEYDIFIVNTIVFLYLSMTRSKKHLLDVNCLLQKKLSQLPKTNEKTAKSNFLVLTELA